jgi:hypothetical protein
MSEAVTEFSKVANNQDADRCRYALVHISCHGGTVDGGKRILLQASDGEFIYADDLVNQVAGSRCPANNNRNGPQVAVRSNAKHCSCVNVFVFDCCRFSDDKVGTSKLTQIPEAYGTAVLYGCANGECSYYNGEYYQIGHLTNELLKHMKPGAVLKDIIENCQQSHRRGPHSGLQDFVMGHRAGGDGSVLSMVLVESEIVVRQTERLIHQIDQLPATWFQSITAFVGSSVEVLKRGVQLRLESYSESIKKWFSR